MLYRGDNSKVKKLLVTLLVLVTAASLCMLGGCKYTDILTEHIEDPVNGTVNENMDPIYKDVDNAKKDSTRVATHRNTSKTLDKQTEELPVYDKNAPDNGPTDQRIQSDDSSHTETATQGTKESKNKKGHTKKNDKDKKKDKQSGDKSDKDSQSKSDTNQTSDDTDDDGKSSSSSNGTSGGNGGSAKVYDDSTYKDLPENVQTVAAAGQYASLVQMFSGETGAHLVAADNAWLSRVKSLGAFDGEGIEDIAVGWSGDTDQNSSGSADNAKVSAIIKAKPDVVLIDGNDDDSNLSKSAMDKLVDAGISVVTMPKLGSLFTSDEDIVDAARIVGSLLSDSTNGYSTKMAKSYISFHDQLVSDDADYYYKPGYVHKYQDGESTTGSAKQGACTTVFVDHIASTTTSTTKASRNYSAYGDPLYLDGETLDTSDGVGMSISGSGYALMDYYFQLGGVVNNSYPRVKPSNSASYAIVAGQDARGILSVDAANRDTPSALWYAPSSDSAVITVGDGTYPAIVARDSDIAKTIQASADKTNGLYNVGQKYEIYVMPSGLSGNWADGTVESFLTMYWASVCLTSSSPSGSSLDGLMDYIKSFYSTYYRVDASKVATHFNQSIYNPLKAACPRS
ncbi:MAG: hypothetical protein ACOX69_00700 [Coriobacteriales bacterium]